MNRMAKPRRESGRLLTEFEIGLARAALDANPRHAGALRMLGEALTRAGRHQEALEVDLRLTTIHPRDPAAFYNLACSYSHLEDIDGAFDALQRAFELGYRDYRHMLQDPDLSKVRRDRRFKELLRKKWGKRQP